ncbi:MAG: hypothetical protein PHV37_01885 [Candidatus Gastranaerophilales bacterium]|nr:hypothetical protein [Candidatus Gastranaerophilales bacterium]
MKNPKDGTKTAMVLNHLRDKGEITVREMTQPPFYLNCPYRIIADLRDVYGIKIFDEYIEKSNKVEIAGKIQKVTTRYKRYFLDKFTGL